MFPFLKCPYQVSYSLEQSLVLVSRLFFSLFPLEQWPDSLARQWVCESQDSVRRTVEITSAVVFGIRIPCISTLQVGGEVSVLLGYFFHTNNSILHAFGQQRWFVQNTFQVTVFFVFYIIKSFYKVSQCFYFQDKSPQPKANSSRKGLFGFHFHIIVCHQDCGTKSQELKWKPWKHTAYWLAHLGFLGLLSEQGPPAQKVWRSPQ